MKKFLILMSLFSVTSFGQVPVQSPPPVVQQQPKAEIPLPKSKFEQILELAHIKFFSEMVKDFFITSLESKKQNFPAVHWPLVKEAAEMTYKKQDIYEKIKGSLTAAMSLKDIEEVEAFFKDQKVASIMDSADTQEEEYLKMTMGDQGVFLKTYIGLLEPDSPKRAYLYLLETQLLHLSDQKILLARLENSMKLEAETLGVSKARKTELTEKAKAEMERVSRRIMEETLDELTYIYQKVSFQDLKFLVNRSKTPGVEKFYETVNGTVKESLLSMGKAFALNLRELHKAQVRKNI